MSIRRSARRSNFTTLDNCIFSPGLSFRAIGLLAYLLSKPDHWEVSVAQLVNFSGESKRPDGRDSVYAILSELIDAGFIRRTMAREGGKLNGYDYEVFDTPQPVTDLPYTDSPCPAAPYTAEPTQVNTDIKQRLNKAVNTESLGGQEAGDGFELAWKAYPKREGSNPKNKAHSSWKARLKEGVTAERMLAGVARYAAFCKAKGNVGTEYVMQAVRFFGKECAFDNEWSAASPGKQSVTQDFKSKDYRSTPDDQLADFLR